MEFDMDLMKGKVVKIYIITHKNFYENYDKSVYCPLLVGANKNSCDTAVYSDNTGDNISEKNSSFCELTGLYWIWKNGLQDITGLCHYRRYFTQNRYVFCNYFMLNGKDIKKYLMTNDIILPERNHHEYFGLTAYENYKQLHNIEDWITTKNIIEEHFPEYVNDVSWFEKEKIGYCYNMMICRKEIMDKYCEWLFTILFEVEKRIDISHYDSYNKRVYGFLSERLINVWVHHQNLRVKEVPVFMTDLKFSTRVKNKFRNIRGKLCTII